MSAWPLRTIWSACAGVGDHADGGGRDPRLAADALGERHLVAGADRDLRVRDVAARRAVDQVDAEAPSAVARARPTARGPSRPRSSRSPRCARTAAGSGRALRDRGRRLAQEARAVVERAAVGVGAAVAERREELVQQIAVRGVNLDGAEAGGVGARPPRSRTRPAAPAMRSTLSPPASRSCRRTATALGADGPPAAFALRARCPARPRADRCSPCVRRARAGCPATAPCALMKRAIRSSGSKCSSLQMPRSCGRDPSLGRDRRRLGEHEARAADRAAARWTKCQSLAKPSSQEYWHIGETPMRLGRRRRAV